MSFTFSTFTGFTINRSSLTVLVPCQRDATVKFTSYTYVSTSLEQTIRFLDNVQTLISRRQVERGLEELTITRPENQSSTQPESQSSTQPDSTTVLARLEERLMLFIEEKFEELRAELLV